MKKLIAGLVPVFLCLSFIAQAETSLKFGGLSFHTTSSDYTNSFHRTFVISHNDVFAGYFKNSYNDDSFVAGYSFVDRMDMIDVALHTGLVYGYRSSTDCYKMPTKPRLSDHKIVCPMLAPEFTINTLEWRPSVAWYGFDAVAFNLNYLF